MASRIQGITVEIGGDTTKLSKALESVNKSIKGTQSGLKDVNKLLKLDPSNTELVVQKQKMLGDAIQATKEKLATLKAAAQQANEQLANGEITQQQYDADELSLYAERCRLYRERKQAVEKLHCCIGKSYELLENHLWETLKLFSGYSFTTVKGLRFHYTVNGNEILIDRKKKSITRSSVNIALKETMEMKGNVNGPKKLKVFGASYLYSIFLRFGLIKIERE